MNSSRSVPFTSTNASVLLDLLRAIAALLVCLEHWRILLYVDFKQIQGHRWLYAVPNIIVGAGHQAVVIFFVLSGYLISGSVFRLLERREWSWKRYLTHRMVRLWVVLIPALLLGALLDSLGIGLHLAPALYAGQTGTHMLGDVANSLHAPIFLENAFFLQTLHIGAIEIKTFGSNGPLWSLAYEFWYYILFPFGLLALRKETKAWNRILYTLAFALCAWFVGRGIFLLFPVWLLGTLLAAVPTPKTGFGIRSLAAALYFPLFFFLGRTKSVTGSVSDYILGIATFLFLWLLLGAKSKASQSFGVRLTRVGARFSYTLYLVHAPFLVLFTAIVAGNTRWQPDGRNVLLGLLALPLVVGYAYAVASVTELRTDTVRPWVEKLLMGNPIRTKLSVPDE